jgi:hypothetical protein
MLGPFATPSTAPSLCSLHSFRHLRCLPHDSKPWPRLSSRTNLSTARPTHSVNLKSFWHDGPTRHSVTRPDQLSHAISMQRRGGGAQAQPLRQMRAEKPMLRRKSLQQGRKQCRLPLAVASLRTITPCLGPGQSAANTLNLCSMLGLALIFTLIRLPTLSAVRGAASSQRRHRSRQQRTRSTAIPAGIIPIAMASSDL